uniref:Amaranthin-like lectin n=1 Tax=Linum usitatissimum TaxID=4006 RepID=A0A097PIF1_LINUS|nr:amaranthin-like lectin [Linum usitatissimum]
MSKSTVAGLPNYMVLRSKELGKCMHYLWNEDEFGEYYKDMGCKRDIDPVSPFSKLQVVPSTIDPTSMIHLRCSYNNKYLKLTKKNGVFWVSATGDEPVEEVEESSSLGGDDPDDDDKNASTLFEPTFPDVDKHVQTGLYMWTFYNKDYDDDINHVVCVYNKDNIRKSNLYEFAPWMSYEETMKAHKEEVRSLEAHTVLSWKSYEAEAKAEKAEIEKVKGEMRWVWDEYVKVKRKAKEQEVRKLKAGSLSALGAGG